MKVRYCYSFVEDEPTAEVAKKIVAFRNKRCDGKLYFNDGFPFVVKGYGNLKKKAANFFKMAERNNDILIITDLDREACPPELINKWFFPDSRSTSLPQRLFFRVAVKEVESWLMADRTALSEHLGISKANFPTKPDELYDPKQFLLSVILKKGRKKRVREMLPGPSTHIGPSYNSMLRDFIHDLWSPERASLNSPSLKRTIKRLLDF